MHMMSENNTHELTDELLADVAGGTFGDRAT